jgi:NADPH:quinone reductase
MNVQQIVLASRPEGAPTLQNFRTENYTLPSLNDEEVLIKSLYFSVDPYMRGRMNDAKSYARPFQVNEAIYGNAIGEIEESKSANYKEGDLVRGILPWATESVVKAESVVKIDTGGCSIWCRRRSRHYSRTNCKIERLQSSCYCRK